MWSSQTSQLTSLPSPLKSSAIRLLLLLLPATPKMYQLKTTHSSQNKTPTKHECRYSLLQPSKGISGGLVVVCLQFQLSGAHASFGWAWMWSSCPPYNTVCHNFYNHQRMSQNKFFGFVCLNRTHGCFLSMSLLINGFKDVPSNFAVWYLFHISCLITIFSMYCTLLYKCLWLVKFLDRTLVHRVNTGNSILWMYLISVLAKLNFQRH